MRKLSLSFILFFAYSSLLQSQIKVLSGGTLIDGYGGKPIYNSIIIIEGETIKQVGRIGEIAIPAGADIISTEGK